MKNSIPGIHHATAIAGDPQAEHQFLYGHSRVAAG